MHVKNLDSKFNLKLLVGITFCIKSVALAGELDCNALIHSLLPRESVSEDTILMIVSKICADLQSLRVSILQQLSQEFSEIFV